MVPVPLNYRLTAAEWGVILDDAAPTLVLARGDLVEAMAPLRAELHGVRTWVALDAPATDRWTSYADWLADSSDAPPRHVARDGDDVYQMYTSGTTGRPKGAVLTHAAVSANCAQLNAVARVSDRDRFLIVAPMYHAAAAINAFNAIEMGATLVIMENFDPSAVAHVLAAKRITATVLVPAMIQAILVHVPELETLSFADLRYIGYGGSPIAANTLRHAMDVFGCEFGQGFGMTEATAVATALTPHDHVRAMDGEPGLLLSCGRPLAGTDVRVVDAEDLDVPVGAIGEVLIRGPQMMRGYWNLPDATASALAGGWLHTGDAGRFDDEGYLYIEDRITDMIVSGGENVYPREVENALFEHDAVADAAVIGVPDERWGETVKAVIVVRGGYEVDEAELIEFCGVRIAGFKCPRSVDFVTELPRNPSGKVLKKVLREPHWQGRTRSVS